MKRITQKAVLPMLLLFCAVATGEPSNDHLAAFYPFAGNADDVSGNGNHGTVHNAELTTDRFGRADNAYMFDGTDANIEIENSSPLILTEAISIAAWVNLPDLSRNVQNIVRKGRVSAGSSDCSYALYVRSYDEFAFYFSGGSVHQTASQDLTENRWFHLAATFDPVAQEVRLYLDGDVVYIQGETGTPTEFDYPMGIGLRNDPGQFFEGTIDEVRVYNSALSALEIHELYDSVIFVNGFETGDESAWSETSP